MRPKSCGPNEPPLRADAHGAASSGIDSGCAALSRGDQALARRRAGGCLIARPSDRPDRAVVEHAGSIPRIPHARKCLSCYEVYELRASGGMSVLLSRPGRLRRVRCRSAADAILAPGRRPANTVRGGFAPAYNTVPARLPEKALPMPDCIVSHPPFLACPGGASLDDARIGSALKSRRATLAASPGACR